MTKHGPTPLIPSLPATAWRIVLAMALVWASMLMVVPAAQSAPGMDMPMQHAMAAADAPAGLVHDMGGDSRQECVVCALCSSLTVSAVPAGQNPAEETLRSLTPMALAGLDRAPDQPPPILSL